GAPAARGGPAAPAAAPAAGFATDDSAKIFGGTACKPATGSQITMGNVSTLSGVLGELFSPVVPALQTFVKAQNECGGLNGHPIRLIIGDDQGDPATAVSVANRQIQSDKITAFVGNIQVLTVDAMVSVVNRTKVPIVGGDLTNNTWFSNPLIFPQGPPPQSISYAMVEGTKKKFGKTKLASVYCAEVPQACSQIDKAITELAKAQGVTVVNNTRISITSPSYQSQCIALQDAGAEVVALIFDAAAQVRFTNDCAKVNFKPQYMAYALGVGNEKQFLGNPSLGGTYVPLNVFGWMANESPAEKFWQASVKKFNPGFTSGNAASLGWVAGALAVAGSAKLGAAPSSQQFVEGLQAIKGNDLGGLTAPLTFTAGKAPKIPYCSFFVSANKDNSRWEKPTSKALCTTVRAPSDPNK
ncbi:MAG: transporter substrate-binding protein, partial [Frankiales bacterium]|nr:transporter substrate-binding protein [Frankiales bacterium]